MTTTKKTPDEHMVDWVVLPTPNGAILGMLKETSEDDIRAEMEEGTTPSATLYPIYTLSSMVYPTSDGGMIRIQKFDRLEHMLGFSTDEEGEGQFLLSGVLFCSEFTERTRLYLVRMMRTAEHERTGLVVSALGTR